MTAAEQGSVRKQRDSNYCLVTTGKHVSNTLAISRQLLGKLDPAATDTIGMQKLRYYRTIVLKPVFSMWFVPKYYHRINRVPEFERE
jgi:hypothetical protein